MIRSSLRFALLALLCACSTDVRPSSEDSAEALATAPFDGALAQSFVDRQLQFGPRVPGTQAHILAGDWLIGELRARADTVIVQEWVHTTADGRRLPMRNILARFKPRSPDRVLYLAHWDSRPISEKESDPALQAQAVPGANDGASGVAILLAVADAIKKEPVATGVDLLLVDGEDWGDFDTLTDVLIGSKYFADHLPEPGYAPLFGVLFDMVGDSNPVFEQEVNSVQAAPEVVQRVWSTAQRLGHGAAFTNRAGLQITDDHVPLIAKGLRVIDIIDLDYPHHHTTKDTGDKIARSTLQMVGDVALALLRDLEK